MGFVTESLKMPSFHLPTKIHFGLGSFNNVGVPILESEPDKVLLVYGSKHFRNSKYHKFLIDAILSDIEELQICGEPSDELIDQACEIKDIDLVVGVGGGSVLDAAKAISILSKNDFSVKGAWSGKRLYPGCDFIAVSTTSGTGSEVTNVSVVTDSQDNVKKSFRSEFMYPKYAIVDPELTLTCPPTVTSSAGLDSLCHAIESFTSKKSNPLTDQLAFKSMKLTAINLLNSFKKGDELKFREGLSQASLLAGMAISNSGLGLCHGIAHAIGGKFKIPHGIACGFLLPYSIEYNNSHTGKYETCAKAFQLENSSQLADYLFELNKKMNIPQKLSEFGIDKSNLKWISENSFSGSMHANPKKMTTLDVYNLLIHML